MCVLRYVRFPTVLVVYLTTAVLQVLFRTTIVNRPITAAERRQLVQNAADADYEVDTRLELGEYHYMNCSDVRDLLDPSKTVEATVSIFQLFWKGLCFTFVLHFELLGPMCCNNFVHQTNTYG